MPESNGGSSKVNHRDTALTWLIPPSADHLASNKAAIGECKANFLQQGQKHVESVVRELLISQGVEDVITWATLIPKLASEAVSLLSPPSLAVHKDIDVRNCVTIKRLVSGNAEDSAVIDGVVARKNVAHKRMRTDIDNPRVIVLSEGLEYHRSPGKLSSLDNLIDQEKDYLRAAVDRLLALKPDILVVERSVARYAQDMLLEAGVTVVINVKRDLLQRVAANLGAKVAKSVEETSIGSVGSCSRFRVNRLSLHESDATHKEEVQQPQLLGQTVVSFPDDQEPQPASNPSLGAQPQALMTFEGCPKLLNCSILLRGESWATLTKLKGVLAYAVHAMYWNRLESAIWPPQLVSAAAALSWEQPTTVLSQCTSIAQASAAAAEAYQGNMVTPFWPSPHLSTYKCPKPLNSGAVAVHASAATVTIVESPPAAYNNTNYYLHGGEQSGAKSTIASSGDPIRASTPESFTIPEIDEHSSDGEQQLEEGLNVVEQLYINISCRNPAKGVLCEPPHPHCMPFYKDGDLPLAAFIAAAAPANRKCPQCSDGAALHLRSFLHGDGLVTLSSIRLPAGKELPDGDKGIVWVWLRPIKRDLIAVEAARKVPLPPEAACLSFSHLLTLLLNTRHMVLDGINMQTTFVKYFGIGSTVLCLHYSTTAPFGVKMPAEQVEFVSQAELGWVEKEIKELTEEADEAFSAIDQAITEQVHLQLSPEAAQPWMDNLLETRVLFMKRVQSTTELIRNTMMSLHQSVQGSTTVQAVWHLNQLRKLLGWIVLQWATSMSAGPLRATAPSVSPFAALQPQHKANLSTDSGSSLPAQTRQQGSVSSSPAKAAALLHHRWGSDSLAAQFATGLDTAGTVSETDYAPKLIESVRTAGAPGTVAESPPGSSEKEGRFIPAGLVANRVRLFEEQQSCDKSSGAVSSDAIAASLHSHKLSDHEEPQNGDDIVVKDGQPPAGVLRRKGPSFTIDLSGVAQPLGGPLSPERGDSESTELADDFERLALQLGHLSRSISQNEESSTSTAAGQQQQQPDDSDSDGSVRATVIPAAPLAKQEEVPLPQLSKVSPVAQMPPSRLTHLLSQFLSGSGRKQHPLHGKVELSGRCLFTAGREGACITVFDDEPTSIIAYFLSTKEYKDYLEETTASILSSSSTTKNDASSLPPLPAPDSTPAAAAAAAAAAVPEDDHTRVLLSSMQLDCQMSAEDSASPVGSFDVARLHTIAYYAPQFAELRRRVIAGGEEAFLASISRCRNWAARGGKSNAFFAKTRDDRYVIKQLSRSERQSFLEFAPEYLQYIHTTLSSGRTSCLAKILGVYQVSLQHEGRPSPFGGRDGVMDVIIMENVFYARSVSRIYDLKGSERDRYASSSSESGPTNGGSSGGGGGGAGSDSLPSTVVLMDENLRELNQTQPTLMNANAFSLLQEALWADTGFLSSLGVMDYSLLVGFDKEKNELVVGLIDYIRQYTWDKQVETWVKKTGILGGAGKDPTVISPALYCKRFRTAISSYFTIVPSNTVPLELLDPDT